MHVSDKQFRKSRLRSTGPVEEISMVWFGLGAFFTLITRNLKTPLLEQIGKYELYSPRQRKPSDSTTGAWEKALRLEQDCLPSLGSFVGLRKLKPILSFQLYSLSGQQKLSLHGRIEKSSESNREGIHGTRKVGRRSGKSSDRLV